MNFLLITLQGFKYYLSMPAVWFALALVILGTALVILARRFARVIRKADNIADNDKYMITFKCVGVVMMFVGVMLVVFI